MQRDRRQEGRRCSRGRSSRAGSAGHANTPRYTFAVITHAQPGDTFWDIIRAGASAAASKDNIAYHYSNNDDPTKQAQLITDAINSHVDGIAVTDPDPQALCPTIKKAMGPNPGGHVQRGHQQLAVLRGTVVFGSDENVAGTAAGKRLAAAGKKNVLCVLQAQGQVQLEARCAGVKAGLGSEGTMTKLYVNGTDNSAMLSSMSAKLTQDKNIDAVITLGAPVALVAINAISQAQEQRQALHLRHQRGRDRQDQVRRGPVGRGPAALPAGLRGRRLAVAVQDQRQRARR